MTEFLVSLIVLIPLFFIIPLLGKYLDIKSSTTLAARYAAWERTVWYGDSNTWGANNKNNGTVQNEIRERFFSAPGTALKNDDGVARQTARNSAPISWTNHRNQALLLPLYTNTTATSTHRSDPGVVQSAFNILLVGISQINSIGSFGQSPGFTPNTSAFYKADVQVRVNRAPTLFKDLSGASGDMLLDPTTGPLIFGSRSSATPTYGTNVIMADGWSAAEPQGGSGSVKSQASGLVPTTMTVAKAAMLYLGNRHVAAGIAPPALPSFFDPGKLQPEEIPSRRLR